MGAMSEAAFEIRVEMTPRWPLRLPHLPGAEAAVDRPAGKAVVQAIRWATAARPATEAS